VDNSGCATVHRHGMVGSGLARSVRVRLGGVRCGSASQGMERQRPWTKSRTVVLDLRPRDHAASYRPARYSPGRSRRTPRTGIHGTGRPRAPAQNRSRRSRTLCVPSSNRTIRPYKSTIPHSRTLTPLTPPVSCENQPDLSVVSGDIIPCFLGKLTLGRDDSDRFTLCITQLSKIDTNVIHVIIECSTPCIPVPDMCI
jgi:hypothetical protein